MRNFLNNLILNILNTDTFRFASPRYLLFIPVILISLYLLKLIKKNNSTKSLILFSNTNFFKGSTKSLKLHLKKILFYINLIGLFIVITGLARPQTGDYKTEIIQYGIDIMLSVDVSLSMSAIDMDMENRLTRLDVLKEVLHKFLETRKGDRLGIVVYGTNSFTLSPLTTDYNMLAKTIDNIEIAMAGPRTNISKSIVVCLNRLRKSDAKEQIIILLTDGKHNVEGVPMEQAIMAAKTLGIKIYSIGFGKEGIYPWKLTDPNTGEIFYRNQQAEIDFEMLQKISRETGGKFYKAESIEDLQNVYDDISKLEQSEIIMNEWTDYRDLFYYFLFIGFIFIILCYFLDNFVLHTIP